MPSSVNASKRSTTSPAAPTVGRGCIGRFAMRACTRAASGWRGSCARRAWWAGAGDGGSRPPSPIPMWSRSICSSARSGLARSSSTASTSGTSPISGLGKAGCTSRPSSTSHHDGSSDGRWPITCAPSWSATRCVWPSRTVSRRRARCSTPTAAPKPGSISGRNTVLLQGA